MKTIAIGVFGALVLFLISLFNIENLPLLWDEGWTLTVARTWVEHGFYGRLLMGAPAPPGLEAAFPVTASVALSFRLFGVGIWQGRLVGVIYLLATVALMYYLARRLYDHPVALGTIGVLFFMSPHLAMHPLFLARLVLAEIPMLFFLLAGYAFFLNALRQSLRFVFLAILFWGLALVTKAQTLPFWLASLGVPLVLTIMRRQWRVVGYLTLALVGSWIASRLWLALQELALQGHTMSPTPIVGLYDVTAFVPLGAVRVDALMTLLVVGVPTLLGIGHTGWHWFNSENVWSRLDEITIVRLALWGLVASWFAWFTLFSVGWIRYLFPATFVGSLFVAATLADWSRHFAWRGTFVRACDAFRRLHFDSPGLGAILAILLVSIFVPVTCLQLFRAYTASDSSAAAVARWLNTQTARNAVIESYESELFFLLDRDYHYPPDQTNVEILRHSLPGGTTVPYAYDAFAANPDYLVVGTVGRESGLYDRVLASNTFRLVCTIGGYDIFEQVR